PLKVPPLRERLEDVPALARHFADRHAVRLGKRVAGISARAIELLRLHAFPGNVRELENEMERAVLLTEPGEEITAAALSDAFEDLDGNGEPARDDTADAHRARAEAFARSEVQAALDRHRGVRTRAAEELGLTYHGLLKRMRRLGMIE